jgi:RNA polymerase sigma-70 factor (ECF subfamily)
MEQRRQGIHDERRIIERVLAGDTRAFAMLVDAHRDRAMVLALRMMRNREDAEEALQDAFVRAFRSLGSFEGKSKFSTWLYRIVFNVCSSAGRRRAIPMVPFDETLPGDLPAGADRPDVACEGAEFERIVAEAIDALPVVYGAIFTLYAINEMSYEEIAEVADLPINTVKTRLFRARAMLRASVAERVGDPVAHALPSTMKEKR